MSINQNFSTAWTTALSSPELYRRGLETGLKFSESFRPHILRKVLIVGVGGSGIVGDVVSALKESTSNIEVASVKSIRTPAYTGPDTAVIAVSYSGETAETNWAALDALSKNAFLAVVSSGGRLTTSMRARGVYIVPVTAGMQPRFAMPEMVGAVYGLLASTSGFPEHVFRQYLDELQSFAASFGCIDSNPAWELARQLVEKPVVVVGGENLFPVIHRMKCQLNENAKHPCYSVVVPEAFHNEPEGWTMVDRFNYVFLRSGYEPLMISDGLDWMENFLREKGVVSGKIVVKASSPQSEILKQILFVDLVSLAVARQKNVDPFELKVLTRLRPLLRKFLP